MIHLPRTTPRPAFLDDPKARAVVGQLGEFLDEGGLGTKQSRAGTVDWSTFARMGAESLVPACVEQFSGMCAFSEVALPQASYENIHPFRPYRDAAPWEKLGDQSMRHYWWLMTSWENLYLASHDVVYAKADSFPVIGERSAGPDAPLDRGVLLDPCVDHPEWYLRFEPTGSVRPVAQIGDDAVTEAGSTIRGEASIAVFGLNGRRLVESRREAMSPLTVAVGHETLAAFADEAGPHRGARRQLAARAVIAELGRDEPADASLIEALTPELSALAWTERGVGDTLAVRLGPAANPIFDAGREIWPELDHQPDPIDPDNLRFSKPVAAPADREVTSVVSPVIERFSIRNFKALEDVTVTVLADVGDPSDDDGDATRSRPELAVPGRFLRLARGEPLEPAVPVTPTIAMIGENGSGKSSILQALALALVSDETRAGLGLDLGGFVRRSANGDAARAEVDVDIVGGVHFELRIDADGTSTLDGWAEFGSDNPVPLQTTSSDDWFLIRAYSATRTLRANGDEPDAGSEIGNLFDPRRTLVDPERWLIELDESQDDDSQFNVVATTLRELFRAGEDLPAIDVADDDPEQLPLTRKDGRVFVNGEPLSWVSDGYRAVLSLFCDVMAGAQQFNPTDMRRARGIILIDEIGAHLHPRWRMQIASLLRREFPEMQIIVSTHEPLCLRGFIENEVVAVTRGRDASVSLAHIDRSPSGYRVDQLLTSEFFGLQSTVDPDENDRLTVYYQLAAKESLTDHEAALMEQVKPDRRQQAFGFSYREQLTYEAVDRYLTERQRRRGVSDVPRDELYREVAEIWSAFESELEEIESGGGDAP